MRRKLAKVAVLTALTVAIASSAALADTVVAGDVVTGGNVSKAAGSSGSARVYVAELPQDSPSGDRNGCNASVNEPITVTVTSGNTAKVTIGTASGEALPGVLHFSACGSANYKDIGYGVAAGATPGNVAVTASGSGGKTTGGTGQSLYNAGSFTITITAQTDSTPPTITPTVSGTEGDNDWYVSSVNVSWTVNDPDSSYTSSGCGATTISTDTVGTTLTCSATSAGGTASESVTIKRDATAPSVTLRPAGDSCSVPGTNGWCRGTQLAGFTATDSISGIAPGGLSSLNFTQSTSTEGSAVMIPSGLVKDRAGNTNAGIDAGPYKIDATAPVVTGTPDRAPNANGWYKASVDVTWSAGSGDTCDAPETYAGPDGSGIELSGSCTDPAGNSANGSLSINYDETAPGIAFNDRTPANANGWNNGTVVVTWDCTDDTSAVVSAQVSDTLSTEGANQTANGTCEDLAGNTAGASLDDIDIDTTAPVIDNAVAAPEANANGWNNSAVTVTWDCDDDLSGVEHAQVHDDVTGEGENQTASATCTDLAGNTASDDYTDIDVDLTDPQITYTTRTASNANGWNNGDVTLYWSCDDALSGAVLSAVDETVSTEGANQSATGTCTDNAGNTATDQQDGVNIDLHAPNAPAASVSPAANAAGWNKTQPVTVHFASGGDNGPSGVDSCTADTDLTAATAGTTVSGTCTDLAGNTGDSASVLVKIDLDDPNAPTASADRAPDYGSWFKDGVTVSFSSNGDAGTVKSGVDASSIPAPVTYTTSGAHTASGTVSDVAGRTSATGSLTVNVDATAPAVNATCPTGVILGSTASASWSASDDESGVNGPGSGSIPVDTSTVGAHTATIPAGTAADNVGHPSAATSCNYSVSYGYSGFLQPINDTSHSTGLSESKFKLGSTIPAKFQIFDASHAAQQQASAPAFSKKYLGSQCDTSTSTEAAGTDTGTSGGTFRYDATAQQYVYNFSTKGLTAGEYRIYAGLGDGHSYSTDVCIAK